MLGPPGAGKGTQAVELAKRFDCADIATGDILRDHVARGTPLGRTAREYIDRGDLVPDEVVISMVMERLAEPDDSERRADGDAPGARPHQHRSPQAHEARPGQATTAQRGFVLDGFPRTVAQAEALDRRLAELGTPLDAALFFEISEEELLKRVRGRAEQLHRSDDTEATIRHRLEVFAIKTRPLVDYYRHRGILIPVDAIGEVHEVTRRILADLEALKAARAARAEPTRADA